MDGWMDGWRERSEGEQSMRKYQKNLPTYYLTIYLPTYPIIYLLSYLPT
jgi:hypothetical protein